MFILGIISLLCNTGYTFCYNHCLVLGLDCGDYFPVLLYRQISGFTAQKTEADVENDKAPMLPPHIY